MYLDSDVWLQSDLDGHFEWYKRSYANVSKCNLKLLCTSMITFHCIIQPTSIALVNEGSWSPNGPACMS